MALGLIWQLRVFGLIVGCEEDMSIEYLWIPVGLPTMIYGGEYITSFRFMAIGNSV